MGPKHLLKRIEQLPALQRMEAEDFIGYLASRTVANDRIPVEDQPLRNALDRLLEHPLGIENFKAPLRDEIYLRD